MKKHFIPLLSAGALLLVSCGGSSEQVIPSGKEVARADTADTFNQAKTSLEESDAFGVSITGEYSLNSKTQVTMEGQNQSIVYSMEGKGLSFEVAAKNYRNSLKGLKASASASGSFAYSATAAGVSQSATSSPALNAYIVDETAYVDGKGLGQLISSVGSVAPDSFAYKIPLTIGSDESISADLDSILEDLENDYASSVKALEDKNGSYSYVYDLDPAKIMKDQDSNQISGFQVSTTGSIQFALTFSEEGFLSMGLAFDCSVTGSMTQGSGSEAISATTEENYHLRLKAEFSYGDSVEVKEVENPDSYTLLQDEED